MGDSLGDRMKSQYENRTRMYLPRRTNTIIRLDGKAFHTFTRGFKKPFDQDLMHLMDHTAKSLCENIQGVKMAYVQSDEISLLLTDYDNTKTDAWFDGNIQKITSVSASLATSAFNKEYLLKLRGKGSTPIDPKDIQFAHFDSRVFTIPDPEEVVNYFIWRQQDWTRNSIQLVGHANFSHKELHGLSCNKIQAKLLLEKNINWNDYSVAEKRGRCIEKKGTGIMLTTYPPQRQTHWVVMGNIPIFTEDRDYIRKHIKCHD